MPGPPGTGGVLVGGGALYIVKKSAPEKQAAAWEYLKFLDDPQTQADLAAGTGYVPIRKSSVELPAIQEQWAKEPGYKVAYDQLHHRRRRHRDPGPGHRRVPGGARRGARGRAGDVHPGQGPGRRAEERGEPGRRRDAGVQLPSHRLTHLVSACVIGAVTPELTPRAGRVRCG